MHLGLGDMIEKLAIINNVIWHLETNIGETKDDAEVGRITKKIRAANRQRTRIRNELNVIGHDFVADLPDFIDIKIDHFSAEKE